MRNIIGILFILLVSSCGVININQEPQENNNQGNYRNNVGYVKFSDTKDNTTFTSISSVSYLADGYGVMATHSLDRQKKIQGQFGTETIDIIIIDNIGNDKTLVYFLQKPSGSLELEMTPYLCTTETFSLVGFPSGKKEMRDVKFVYMNVSEYWLSSGAETGFSGGLCINDQGKVLGMISSYADRSAPENAEIFNELNYPDQQLSIVQDISDIYLYIAKQNNKFAIN